MKASKKCLYIYLHDRFGYIEIGGTPYERQTLKMTSVQ